jgi:hypothetical protein
VISSQLIELGTPNPRGVRPAQIGQRCHLTQAIHRDELSRMELSQPPQAVGGLLQHVEPRFASHDVYCEWL